MITWNSTSIRSLRLRFGWSQCDLARRLHCEACEITCWEQSESFPSPEVSEQLFLLLKQAEFMSNEMAQLPQAEAYLEKGDFNQIDFRSLSER